MSAQAPTTPKGPKGSRRNPKRFTTPNSNSNNRPNDTTPLTAKSNPSLLSHQMNESNNMLENSGNKKKKCRSVKKNNNNNNNNPKDNSKPSVMTNGNNHRHTSSHSSLHSPPVARDSPHYAGPTFHASPAPSALPIPSFFSKSVPDGNYSKPDDSNDDSPDTETGTSTPTKAKIVPQQPQPQKDAPTASPLDFLFKAARDARSANHTKDSEDRSVFDQSPPLRDAAPVRQGEATPGGVFPLELESPDPTKKISIGPSFATPYKDRMNAFRSTSSPSRPMGDTPDQDQKKVKAEALKNLLLNPTPQRPASTSSPRDRPNLHTSNSTSTLETNHATSPFARNTSNPSTPVPFHSGPWNAAAHRETRVNGGSPHRYVPNHPHETYSHRKPSHLRTEISSNNHVTPPHYSDERHHYPFGASSVPAGLRNSVGDFVSPTPNRTVPFTNSGARGAHARVDPLETKRMEDDLRRVLKLDVAGSRGNGLEQSIA